MAKGRAYGLIGQHVRLGCISVVTTLTGGCAMPTKPLPQCKEKLCDERVKEKGVGYCVIHLRDRYKSDARKSDTSFYNDRKWRKYAKQFLSVNPYCMACMMANVVERATVADHIQPIRAGGRKFDRCNLQALCTSCHNRKRATEK